jgi:hypothetical protein
MGLMGCLCRSWTCANFGNAGAFATLRMSIALLSYVFPGPR